jgi:hypothetical protein
VPVYRNLSSLSLLFLLKPRSFYTGFLFFRDIVLYTNTVRGELKTMPWKDKEKQKEYQKKWREINRERLREEGTIRMRKYRVEHPELKEYNINYGREYRLKIRNQVFDHYGWKCSCCGESHPEFLTIDHINNDGAEHRKKIETNYIYLWLIQNNFPEGFQTLCMNCNFAKELYGSCPHKKEILSTNIP